ncbi:MAG: HAD family hydrolase [Eubacteriales bacterium]|nr:HAD family hydrolase [Eubacteriales bacterium]
MALKAVFFDLDDTFYTSFQACDAYAYERLAAWAEDALGVSGAAFTEAFRQARQQLARQQPGMPPVHDRVLFAQRALEQLGCDAIGQARRAHRVYWDAVLEKMVLRPGVTALLDDLRCAGIRTAVCTDMLADIQMQKLEQLGLSGRIDYLVSSEEAGMDKPGAPIFWLALQKCGCLPHEAIMVGDNFRHDIQGALDVGLAGVWLNWTDLPRPADTRPYIEAHTFTEAAAYIRTLL